MSYYIIWAAARRHPDACHQSQEAPSFLGIEP
jgi:hypothetical protein